MVYHLYYFSATGNTENSARIIEGRLKKAGNSVEMVRINRWTEPLPALPDCVVLVYPTFAWRPPALVMRFLARLPFGNGTRAAILTADGGGSFGSIDVAEHKLNAKGYRPIVKSAANYPDNWTQMISAATGHERQIQINRGIVMTGQFVEALLRNESLPAPKRTRLYGLLDFTGILFALVGRRFLGKLFVADNDCTSCGLCEKSCPVGAIVMNSGSDGRPFWKFNCESCNRCINTCPERAINSSLPRAILMMCAIGLFAALGFFAYSALITPLYAQFPQAAVFLLSFIGFTAILLLAHFLAMAPFDRFVLRPLQTLPVVRKLICRSFTKGFNRYTFDGYTPPRETPFPDGDRAAASPVSSGSCRGRS